MTASGSDPLRDEALTRLLGCSRASGPRGILGLGQGPIDPDTLEAAFVSRKRRVQAAGAPAALTDAAIAELEAAVAALRSADAGTRRPDPVIPPIRSTTPTLPPPLSGIPTPPVSPSSSPGIPTPPVTPQSPRMPTPIRPTRDSDGRSSRGNPRKPAEPVRPKAKITSAHLMPFDIEALKVLLAGGGWNARTRVRLAALASRAGLDASSLARVVSGLAGFMREEGVAGTFGEVSRASRQHMPAVSSPGRVESTMLRISEGLGRELSGSTRASFYRVVTFFGIVAVVLGAMLLRILTTPSSVVRDAETRRRAAVEMLASRSESDETPIDGTHTKIDSRRPGVAEPCSFDRPPMFRGRPVPETIVFELELVRQQVAALDDLSRRCELGGERLGAEQVAEWSDAIERFSRCWVRMPIDDRAAVSRGIRGVLQWADAPDLAEELLRSLEFDPEAPIEDSFDPWRRAFRGGVLGEIVLDDRLPEAVRTAARRQVSRQLPGSDARGRVDGPFATLAGRTLDLMGAVMVGHGSTFTSPLFEDTWERWFEAQAAIRRPEAIQGSLVAVIGLVLEKDQALGSMGLATDLLGRLIREVDWTASGPDPDGLRTAYQAWMRNTNIDTSAIWVLGSILDGPAGIGWYRPDFVVARDAEPGRRLNVMDDVIRAWPRPRSPRARGELLPVDPDLLERLDTLRPAVAGLIASAGTIPESMQAVLAAERLALAASLLSANRAREAEAALGLVSGQVESGTTGVDVPEWLNPRVRSNDGEFAESLRAARSEKVQISLIKALQADQLSGDLGPRDAAVLAPFVWKGGREVVEVAREAALGLFADGPNLAIAMLGTVDQARSDDGTTLFVEQYTGLPLPGIREDGWELAVRTSLMRHAIAVLDSDALAIDLLADEIAMTVRDRASARGGEVGFAVGEDPTLAAAAASNAARQAAAGLFLPSGGDVSLPELDRRRVARRRVSDDRIRTLVAEHISELEYLEFILEALVPIRRDDLRAVIRDAEAERASAGSGLRQAGETALRMVDIERIRLVPRDTNPLGGVS